ncbi:hypothetical protein GCM10010977_28920 [Citricoccus zhacaiensis]|uniref:Uncharacterized protein n=1 Tax=Citricoccus zhacaiensis TaxID=489142 RepID=A0ABQ2MCT3_9MICC|nr:hypothetical protein [Citricoccus zhacaiensis]GGO48708.1 hypothetical protein GCM10010977_28920 [Citricoccus zhacaiensis]
MDRPPPAPEPDPAELREAIRTLNDAKDAFKKATPESKEMTRRYFGFAIFLFIVAIAVIVVTAGFGWSNAVIAGAIAAYGGFAIIFELCNLADKGPFVPEAFIKLLGLEAVLIGFFTIAAETI